MLVGVISLVGSSSLLANTTSDYDVGVNDFPISDMGIDNELDGEASDPIVAHNSQDHEYLIVWKGSNDDNTGGIYGQRIDAATGAEIGENDFLIIQIDPSLLELADPFGISSDSPDVAYNATTNEYLVTWAGRVWNSDESYLGQSFDFVYGQRLDATGAEIGVDDFRIDDTTDENDYLVGQADVTYNPTANEYLVAWGSAEPAGLIWQTLDSEGQPIAQSDAPISDISPFSFDSFEVAYHAVANEYLFVWSAESGSDLNVYGQRLDATTGEEAGTNDFPIGTLVDGLGRTAPQPAVAYNDTTQEYLVVWSGAPDELGDTQIHGQRLSATGQELGADDFVLSQHGSADETNIARGPDVIYNPTDNQYLVTWSIGSSILPPNPSRENEIYGQLIDGSTGAEVGINDFRISDMGPDGPISHAAGNPALAYNEKNNEYLVAWHGNDMFYDFEIYGQRLSTAKKAVVAPDPAQEQRTSVYLPLTVR